LQIDCIFSMLFFLRRFAVARGNNLMVKERRVSNTQVG